MINFNFDYLKFHSFNYNKKFTNERNNNEKWSKLKNEFSKTTKAIKSFQSFNEFKENNKKFRYHSLDKKVVDDLLRIIKKEHKNLYQKLNQNIFIWVVPNKLHFFQFHFKKGMPLMCLYYNEEIIPLIFDLNHCFYKNTTNHKYRHKKSWKQWDHRNIQKDLKEELNGW